jgi:hypothetical protein
MTIYKNISIENIREQKTNKEKEKRINTFASCNCGAPCENSHHFFFNCDKYTDNREILFDSLNWLPSIIIIDIKLLTLQYVLACAMK